MWYLNDLLTAPHKTSNKGWLLVILLYVIPVTAGGSQISPYLYVFNFIGKEVVH